MKYNDIWKPLVDIYDEGEAKAIARYLLEVAFSITIEDIYSGALDSLNSDDEQRLARMFERLRQGEPVQYVAGYADFCGRQFAVDANVLIPRPETQRLCLWVIEDGGENSDILDIGTGSGCIATTLALDIPKARVTAWDISDGALHVAKSNADRLGAHIDFRHVDALCPPTDNQLWDIIVSNPPYICEKEKSSIHTNVLDHEPSTALFVPDDDPLLFYRSIAIYAKQALRKGGKIYFEINPIYVEDIVKMLAQQGFFLIEIKEDQYGKLRMIKAVKPWK